MTPLTDDEAALLYHIGTFGSAGWPIAKVGRSWHWRQWRSVCGAPIAYRTKRLAEAAFQAWEDLARMRWAAMKKANPNLSINATGIGQIGKMD